MAATYEAGQGMGMWEAVQAAFRDVGGAQPVAAAAAPGAALQAWWRDADERAAIDAEDVLGQADEAGAIDPIG